VAIKRAFTCESPRERFQRRSSFITVKQMSETISIAMCTYNGARFLEEQLASLAAQTQQPDELVICDDCSADDSTRIINAFSSRSSFPVRLKTNEQTLGSTKNFEQAITLCRGDVIALSDQDDVWRADKLAKIAECFSASPTVGMVFSNAEVVDEQLQSLGDLWNKSGFDATKQKAIREGRAFEVLLPGWWVTGATMAFRAKFKELILPIPNDVPVIHDGWISLMIAAVAEVGFVAEPLVLYRQHARQQLGAPDRQTAETEEAKAKFASIREAMLRPNYYLELMQNANAVRQRLSRQYAAEDDQIARVENVLKHLQARSNLPKTVIARLPLVFGELVTMRYHRYSNGLSSAAKDLLASPERDAID
jgi:glycosyltransferase involved in cell wall biosynthesis